MASERERARERAGEQGTDWFILLQDDPDDPELRRRFESWRARNPVNAEAWASTERTARLIAGVPPRHAAQWQPLLAAPSAVSSGRRPGRTRRLGRGLAGLALAASIAVLALPAAALHFRADYMTGTGEMRTVRLEDGSIVTVAPDSAIAIAYTGTERRVELLAGEAFFEVVHDPAKPFRVAAGGIETSDLGTGFDVRLGEKGAVVAVQEGSVRVGRETASPNMPETLGPGQSVRIAWTGETVRSDEPPAEIAAWRRNQLIAQNQPMGEVVNRLRPYFGGRIILADARLAQRPVTGVYNLADPVEALRGIAGAHGAVVRRITPWVLLISRG